MTSQPLEHTAAPETARPQSPLRGLTTFDRFVIGVIVLLLLGIGLTVALGDRVGITLVRVAPLESGHSTSRITLQFSEAMERDTVESRFRLEPAVEGSITWSGTTMNFRPVEALRPGAEYTAILAPGALGTDGREVLSEYRFSFTVAQPRIAYLAPADGTPQNIWLADPNDPSSAEQITFSPSGIYDFGVSPDGTQIAFAERNTETNTYDIKLLDLENGGLRQITNCVDSDCTTPVWRPDGSTIAYQRVDFNTDLGESVGASPTRVWLIDLTTTPATTRPLFSDLQMLGYSPQWSADGDRIALFNRDQGILVYDLTDNSIAAIPSRAGSSGALSPDGQRVVFPEIVLREDQQVRSYLKLADLDTNSVDNLTDPETPVQDERVVWNPQGDRLAVARRFQDERYTRGYQIYLMNPEDGSATALTDDPRYANGFFFWDPTGEMLVVQRFPELDENDQPNAAGRPEIWTVSVDDGSLVKVATNAFHPRWVP